MMEVKYKSAIIEKEEQKYLRCKRRKLSMVDYMSQDFSLICIWLSFHFNNNNKSFLIMTNLSSTITWISSLMNTATILYFVSPWDRLWRQRVFQRKMLNIAYVTCVLSHALKKEFRDLTHKGCILQRISFGALSDLTVVLGMRQSIVKDLLLLWILR